MDEPRAFTATTYADEEVHPTVKCPECGARMFWKVRNGGGARNSGKGFWACERFLEGCRGARARVGDVTGWTGQQSDHEPYNGGGLCTATQRRDIIDEVALLVRDALLDKNAAWSGMYASVGVRVSHYRNWTAAQADTALAWLREERVRLEAARPAPAAPPVHGTTRPECDEIVRDAFGSMTICTSKMRWCLGVQPHATAGHHTDDNEGVSWGTAADAEELHEAAMEGFAMADSRRRA